MRVLELFSGTGSVGKVCKQKGWEVTSLDFIDKWNADIVCDILEWDYKSLPQDSFDLCWMSPPCCEYSKVKDSWLGRELIDGKTKERYIFTKEIQNQKRLESDKLVKRALDIVDYFKPKYWFMENPATGNLGKRDVVKGIPYYDVDYCKYSNWGYRKRTRIWTNKKDFIPKKCCKDCENMDESKKKHVADVSRNYSSPQMRYRIPEKLILELFDI